jgi:UDP-glucose 4-epimerase
VRVLITGALGKVGSAAVLAFLDAGHVVTACDRGPAAHETDRVERLHYVHADLVDSGSAFAVVPDHDVVVHAAAIPDPTRAVPAEVLRNNLMSTFNVVEACRRAGVARLVHVSSESVAGFTFAECPVLPTAVPIDERHSTVPQDPYAQSKLFGEQLLDALVARSQTTAISLRPSWVQWEGNYERNVGPSLRDPTIATTNLWGYIDAYDLADALVLAAAASVSGHERLLIVAPDNVANRPLAELVAAQYGSAMTVGKLARADASGWDVSKAQALIGFAARRSWRDHLTPDGRLNDTTRRRLEQSQTGIQRARAALA